MPDFPDWVFQGGVTLEPFDGLLMNISARHLESRFTNFINSEKVGGYTIVNAYIDIGDGFAAGPFSQVKARVNIDNLFDKEYIKDAGNAGTGLGMPTFIAGEQRFYGVSATLKFGG